MPNGSLIQQMRNDTQEYLQGDFSVELTLVPNYGNVTFIDGLDNPYVDGDGNLFTSTAMPDLNKIVINGLATRHSTSYDPDTGLPMLGENCHCSFSEKTLNELGFATRNANNKIIVKGWLVSWADITGITQYRIVEVSPDETLGLIKCMLEFYG